MIFASAVLALLSTPAFAFGPAAIAGAQAAAGAVGIGEGGDGGTGVGVGKGGSATGGSANSHDDSTTVGVGLAQAPTAGAGPCAKGTKFAFGAVEWTDFSDKCLNYELAIIAEKAGQYERANAWVRRADGIE